MIPFSESLVKNSKNGNYNIICVLNDLEIYYIRKLAGKTAYISGASRGIGKAIALKLAKDGANILIAAKTATAHPKLPGTIYTAAKESMIDIKCVSVLRSNRIE